MKSARSSFAILLVGILATFVATPSFAGKQEARDFATGATVIGAAGVITPEPVTTALGAGALLGQGIGFLGMGIWDSFFSAPSRPNPTHAQQESTTPSVPAVNFTPIAGSGPVYDAVNASLISAAAMIDASRSLDTSLTRYYGAIVDGNTANQELQKLEATIALIELETHIASYRSDLLAMSTVAQSTDFATLSTTVAEVLSARDDIVLNGFPASEDFVFDQANATTQETNLALAEVALVTGATLTDQDLKGSVIFDRLSTALGKVDIRELLPAGFAPVSDPNALPMLSPGSLILLFVLLLLVALAIRGRSRGLARP